MTTFKNNAKYAELLMSYLDMAFRGDIPVSASQILSVMRWRFKGGSLEEASKRTRLQPETSLTVFPDRDSLDLARHWGNSRDSLALEAILRHRMRSRKKRATDALLGTWMLLTSSYGSPLTPGDLKVFSGMKSVYHYFRTLWAEARGMKEDKDWELLIQGASAGHLRGGKRGPAHSGKAHTGVLLAPVNKPRVWAPYRSKATEGHHEVHGIKAVQVPGKSNGQDGEREVGGKAVHGPLHGHPSHGPGVGRLVPDNAVRARDGEGVPRGGPSGHRDGKVRAGEE